MTLLPHSSQSYDRAALPLSSPTPEGIGAEAIRVTGTVQGVGFRPTVYRLAVDLQLRGHVLNDGEGVLIHVGGLQVKINQFVARLLRESPPLAKIACIQRQPLRVEDIPDTEFAIVESDRTPARTDIAADAATCPQCRADLFNPRSRYFRYPFTNCTHCGPRLSILRGLPYDRSSTSMAWFRICHSCSREYQDVGDRRFHAQPIACPVCGPKIWLERADGKRAEPQSLSLVDEAEAVATLLLRGDIVAIKGLGGVHLACDATNETAVGQLRQGKGRDHKPFALMVRDLAAIEPYCELSAPEADLLMSPAAPIVLLGKKPVPDGGSPPPLAPSLAPNLLTLGVMLPYTPLHHLIFQRLDRPMVMTSGNRSDAPQCITNEAVREQLGTIAPYFLLHNRDIVNRLDDSVVRVTGEQVQMLRRARGYAPAPIDLPAGFETVPAVLALGGELKNTFCLVRPGQAILSQHLGDLEQAAAYQAYRQALDLYLKLFEYQPEGLVVDCHPEYLSTKLGQELAQTLDIPIVAVQHHHAHIAACMVDNHLPLGTTPILGIALDGLGYGDDHSLWGGEFLLADYRRYHRLAHLKPVAMLGGTQAIRQPWRNTYAHLIAAFGCWEVIQQEFAGLPLISDLAEQPRPWLDAMLAQGLSSPLASSAGRLFDAVAAALGICYSTASYEGQGAMELEALIEPGHLQIAQHSAYEFSVHPGFSPGDTAAGEAPLVLDPAPLWQALLTDRQRGTPIPLIAARFHVGLGNAIAQLAHHLTQQHALTTVALSGGVFQNQILATQVQCQLKALGLQVLTHRQVPANDGGLSLGQAAIAAAQGLDPPPSTPRSPLCA